MRRARHRRAAVEASGFSESDRAIVVRIYSMLSELVAVVGGGDELTDPAELLAFAARPDVSELAVVARQLGASIRGDDLLAEAVHDIRGGALSAVFLLLTRSGRGPLRSDLARSLALMARDHMKMMRNVAKDLDGPGRVRDLTFRPHSLDELARALREFTATVDDQPVVVEVACKDDRVISESCVECAAIDRVAYNLLNNAVRYTDRPLVRAWLLTLRADLRVVIANSVSEAHRKVVAEQLDRDRGALFGSFTTSGSGHGLRIVSELVGRAYGVAEVDALTREGYIGAKLADDTFLSWFHWPLAGA